MRIYLAGPLFCQGERVFNLQLTGLLEQEGYSVFLPQRDGVQCDQPPYNEMTGEALGKAIFKFDQDNLQECDVFLILLDGRVPDEGACVELGIAHSHQTCLGRKILLIGLQTDVRSAYASLGMKNNPMILGALDIIVDNEENLMTALRNWRQLEPPGN